jgi:ATP-binding cassette subfamily B protein
MMHFKNSTTENLRQLFFEIAPREFNKQFFLLILLMTVGSILELISIGVVVPIMYAISAPEDLLTDPKLSLVYEIFGGEDPKTFVINLLFVFGVFFILSSIARFLIVSFNAYVSFGFGRYLAKRLLERIISSDTDSINSDLHSNYVNLITAKSVNITNGIIFPTFLIINTLMLSLLLVIFGLSISPKLFLISVSFFCLIYLAFGFWLKPKLERNSRLIAATLPKQMKFSIDLFGSLREIIINSLGEAGVKKFGENDKIIKDLTRKNLIISLAPRYFIEPLVVVVMIIVVIAISSGAIGSASSITFMGVMAFSLQRFLPIFQGAYTAWSNIQSESAILAEVMTILKVDSDDASEYSGPVNHSAAGFLPVVKPTDDPELLFKSINLAYGYPEKDLLFNNVDIEIKRGDRIAIVGESGSGKSTLVDIIMGIIIPRNGEACYSRYEPDATIPFAHYWERVAYVPQDIRFFNDTLSNNINLLNNNKLSEIRLFEAIKFANLQDLVERLEFGLDETLDDDGANFSGGERQRIGLARAVYKKDADFIIFDEPTSALDKETSQYIIDRIRDLDPHTTVLIVTHDESILCDFNKIYRVAGGFIELVSREMI